MFLCLFFSVIVEQIQRFIVQLNDVWVMRGGTAVFSCEVNPQYVRDYVKVTGWTQEPVEIEPGLYFISFLVLLNIV